MEKGLGKLESEDYAWGYHPDTKETIRGRGSFSWSARP